jgi:hypothetical protein
MLGKARQFDSSDFTREITRDGTRQSLGTGLGRSVALVRGGVLFCTLFLDCVDEFVLLSLPIRVQDYRIDPRDRVLYGALLIILILKIIRKPYASTRRKELSSDCDVCTQPHLVIRKAPSYGNDFGEREEESTLIPF